MERCSVGRVALVTGASAGIGAEICRTLVKSGMKVVGCARSVERIQKIADELKDERGLLKGVKCDLRKEEDILAMFQQIRSDPDLGGVDVCVNNAGLAYDDSLLEGKTEEWREVLEVNVLALCICTRESFKSMKERGVDDGHFILLNSMSGHRVKPEKDNHFYAATKHAVTAILHGLRYEFREAKMNTKVTVPITCLSQSEQLEKAGPIIIMDPSIQHNKNSISPGYVETEFAMRMLKDEDQVKKLHSTFNILQPSDIVDAVMYALSSAPRTQIDDILICPIDQTN